MNAFLLLFFVIFPTSLFAQTVESDNFVLTDGNGHTTAQITKSGEGTPALFFYDTAWVPRISIGLYSDGVPGIVLNDEKWLATALLRMVNNQGDPVLVLKEKWQDKFIIDKNGIRWTTWTDGMWMIQVLLISLLSGGFGGFATYTLLQNKNKKLENPYGGNIS